MNKLLPLSLALALAAGFAAPDGNDWALLLGGVLSVEEAGLNWKQQKER